MYLSPDPHEPQQACISARVYLIHSNAYTYVRTYTCIYTHIYIATHNISTLTHTYICVLCLSLSSPGPSADSRAARGAQRAGSAPHPHDMFVVFVVKKTYIS